MEIYLDLFKLWIIDLGYARNCSFMTLSTVDRIGRQHFVRVQDFWFRQNSRAGTSGQTCPYIHFCDDLQQNNSKNQTNEALNTIHFPTVSTQQRLATFASVRPVAKTWNLRIQALKVKFTFPAFRTHKTIGELRNWLHVLYVRELSSRKIQISVEITWKQPFMPRTMEAHSRFFKFHWRSIYSKKMFATQV